MSVVASKQTRSASLDDERDKSIGGVFEFQQMNLKIGKHYFLGTSRRNTPSDMTLINNKPIFVSK